MPPDAATRAHLSLLPAVSSTTNPINARGLTPLLVQVALGSSGAGTVLWNEKKKRFEWIGEVETLSKASTKRSDPGSHALLRPDKS